MRGKAFCRRLVLARAAVIGACVVPNLGANAEPFAVIDHYPVARMFAPPAPTSAAYDQPDGQRFSLAADWSTFATVSERVSESLIFDGEALTLTGRWQWQRNDWRIGVDVPFTYQSGGALDGLVDGFHDLFDLPEGDRPKLPKDELRYTVIVDGVTRVDVRESGQGVGDLLVHVGRAVRKNHDSGSAWRAHAKLPTGSSSRLLGSGTLALGAQWHGFKDGTWRERGWRLYGGAGAQWHDGSDVLADLLRPVVGFAHAGWEIGWWPRVTLRAQFDFHTARFDSDLNGLDRGLSFTAGGDVLLGGQHTLQIALVEDIAPRTVPDVVFHVRWVAGVR